MLLSLLFLEGLDLDVDHAVSNPLIVTRLFLDTRGLLSAALNRWCLRCVFQPSDLIADNAWHLLVALLPDASRLDDLISARRGLQLLPARLLEGLTPGDFVHLLQILQDAILLLKLLRFLIALPLDPLPLL